MLFLQATPSSPARTCRKLANPLRVHSSVFAFRRRFGAGHGPVSAFLHRSPGYVLQSGLTPGKFCHRLVGFGVPPTSLIVVSYARSTQDQNVHQRGHLPAR
jgi:hypothetical protein